MTEPMIDPEVAWRVAVMRAQMPEGSRPIPFLVARPGIIPPAGRCVSCGEPVPELAAWPGRCVACRQAAQIVVNGG